MGRVKAQAFRGRFEAGWRFDETLGLRGFALTPFAAIQGQWVQTPIYRESAMSSGLNPFLLTFTGRTNSTVRTEIGLRTDWQVTPEVSLFTRTAWHAYLTRDSSITAGFTSLPGTSFTVIGGRSGAHAAAGSVGLDWRVTPTTTLSTRLEGEISDRHMSASGTARLQVRF
jgi:outer membrane autotransporter protein